MDNQSTSTGWEAELANLLSELSDVQDDLLDVLAEKRRLMVASDGAGMSALEQREQSVAARLQQCVQRRETLLRRADQQGLPSGSIRALAEAIPADASSGDGEGDEAQAIEEKRATLGKQAKAASLRARLLQHESLTNWVLAQRTLLHLSQILEIVATGGVEKPTYAKGPTIATTGAATGAIVDRAA
ncbi:MAG: flagellar export chaperone FlgN [Planctomycetes bacterium]|nr:flagellar export chaperone FlgN [Planctomycetota bacterium]